MRRFLADASGGVADLGVLVPIAAALVLNNGFDPSTLLVGVGGLYVVAGFCFGVPVPVQPIKAAAAITIARDLDPAVLSSGGIVLGIIVFSLGASGLSEVMTRIFTTPIIRGLQLGVGLILLDTALGLLDSGAQVLAASVVAALVLFWSMRNRLPAALLVVLGGIAFSLMTGARADFALQMWGPEIVRDLGWSTLVPALILLVVPQLPLTFGNAVAAVVDLEKDLFGAKARRVTPRRVSMTCGSANAVVGLLGGMPMCHGSNGLTAHHRAGARTYRMNLIIGGSLLTAGLFAGPFAFEVLALIPLTVLAGLLAFTGVSHGALVLDQRGLDLAVSVGIGVVGFATANLALGLGLGLALFWARRLALWLRIPLTGPSD